MRSEERRFPHDTNCFTKNHTKDFVVSDEMFIFAAESKILKIMATRLGPSQQVQLHSFWNLLQTTDEKVQRELYVLLYRKYANKKEGGETQAPTFLQMQGVLKGQGDEQTDCQMLDEYLQEKYGV